MIDLGFASVGAVIFRRHFPPTSGCAGDELVWQGHGVALNVMGQPFGPEPLSVGQLTRTEDCGAVMALEPASRGPKEPPKVMTAVEIGNQLPSVSGSPADADSPPDIRPRRLLLSVSTVPA